MDKKTFETALHLFKSEFIRLHEIVETIPKTPEDLQKLLTELKDADLDKSESFKRFPRNGKEGPYNSDAGTYEEVQADWFRCTERFDKAIQNLINFAKVTCLEDKTENPV